MNDDIIIWLERLSALHKSQIRKSAAIEGVQLVHLEILQYLSICNKYSNTAQGISEYLGQTKSSISQSLKFIEKVGHIKREPNSNDKRSYQIFLTKDGKECIKRMNESSTPDLSEVGDIVGNIKTILYKWQEQNDLKGFGQCKSCYFNKILEKGGFQCGLTQEPLSETDIQQICREYKFK